MTAANNAYKGSEAIVRCKIPFASTMGRVFIAVPGRVRVPPEVKWGVSVTFVTAWVGTSIDGGRRNQRDT